VLLHATIGEAGRLLDLAPPQLYYAGRLVSLILTLVSLALAAAILCRLRVSPWFALAALVAWLSAEAIIEHAVSYRPDHWNLFLSLCACHLLLRADRPAWAIALLIIIPVAAFFIKANGVFLVVPIACSLWLERRARQALWTSVGSLMLLSLVSMLLQYFTAGRFAEGLFAGTQVPSSVSYLTALLRQPQHWIPLLVPICLLGWVAKTNEPERRVWRVILLFWLCSLGSASLSALRAGSNMYYFVEPYTYGVLLVTGWGSRVSVLCKGAWLSHRPALAGLCLMFSLHAVQPWFYLLAEQPVDATVAMTRRVGAERVFWADLINREGWRCYSDDAALNVLLDRPTVIYPLIQNLMLLARRLSVDDLLRPVINREYDLVLLTGLTVRYRGVESVPPVFMSAVDAHYERMSIDSKYQVFAGARARATLASLIAERGNNLPSAVPN
jgi:hypothetical protein